MEIQWMFSRYESLAEIVDIFGIEVDGSSQGLYLDGDSLQMPLNSCGLVR